MVVWFTTQAATAGGAVLATSSSSIGASLIAADLDNAGRIIVGHPFNRHCHVNAMSPRHKQFGRA